LVARHVSLVHRCLPNFIRFSIARDLNHGGPHAGIFHVHLQRTETIIVLSSLKETAQIPTREPASMCDEALGFVGWAKARLRRAHYL
jgi:hypothetical protein